MSADQSIVDASGDARAIQRDYYNRTAHSYDQSHCSETEHRFALHFLDAAIANFGVRSVLDVGAGTGRVARTLAQSRPGLRVVSVEPVAALREIARAGGLEPDAIVYGDATALGFADAEFDLVCEFGVLHHVPRPAQVVSEMLRVARVGVLISDCNNYGQGSRMSRFVKRLVRACGLWRLFVLLRTRGRGYMISEEDGLFYSYSVFDNFRQLASECDVYLLNTLPGGIAPLHSAPHVVALAIKRTTPSN